METIPIFAITIGAVAGGIFGYGKQYLEKTGILAQLNPPTEAFDLDPYLHELFLELNAYRDIDDDAFSEAVKYMDRILLLEKQLRNKSTYPVPGDITRINTFRKHVVYEFQTMYTKCTDARRLSLLKQLGERIIQRVNDHYNCIAASCARLRAEDALEHATANSS